MIRGQPMTRTQYSALLSDDTCWRDAVVKDVHKYGFALVEGVPPTIEGKVHDNFIRRQCFPAHDVINQFATDKFCYCNAKS